MIAPTKTKELLTVEFRYCDTPQRNIGEDRCKTITIGIYDSLEEAIENGNKVLQVLSKHFEIRPGDKFIKNHVFGLPSRLVSNCCYPTKGISYFAKITRLDYVDLESMVQEVFEARERYEKHLEKETEEG